MKVLVTGAAGYIGSVLCGKLLSRGHSVIALDSLLYKQGNPLAYCFSHRNFSFINIDLRGAGNTYASMVSVEKDVIIPLAGIVGQNICENNPILAEDVNYGIVKELIESLRKDQLVIFPNTNSGYGRTSGQELCTEETEMSPISVYGTTKCNAEKIVLDRGGISLRLATVFGVSPRMRLDLLVNDLTYRAYFNTPTNVFEVDHKRNFISVYDVADYFVYFVENGSNNRGEIFNVGNDEINCTKLDLLNIIKEKLPNFECYIDNETKDPDQRNYIVSSQKLYNKVGFKPTYTLEDGIEDLISCYRTFPINEIDRETHTRSMRNVL